MRCRPGCRARVVRNDGLTVRLDAIVICVEFFDEAISAVNGRKFTDVWAVAASGRTRGGLGLKLFCPDAWLVPLEDNDGEDEVLRIAGKPEQVTA